MACALSSVSPALPAGLKEIVFEQSKIRSRVHELASRISRDYAGRDLVVAGILKGAFIFTSDLVREMNRTVDLDFIGISRYRRSPAVKEVRLIRDLEVDIQSRNLLLVEDLIDTGLTLNYLIDQFRTREPESIAVCTLLDRPVLRLADIPVRYRGFSISEEFVVGYGLDYQDRYRDLPYIASMAG